MKNIVKFACIAMTLMLLLSGCGKKDDSDGKTPKDKSNKFDIIADSKSELPPFSKKKADSSSSSSSASKTSSSSSSAPTTSASSAGSQTSEQKSPGGSSSSSQTPMTFPAPAQSSASGLSYINGVLIANKSYSLPADYAPGIDSTAQSAFNQMQADAAKEGINLYIISGFRSYDYQATLYNNYAASDGKEAADRYSARPGHSEHQTGLAFDLNSLSQSFKDTAEGRWLAANCHKYGFIIRYPEGKEAITGYMYEPWHVRYLGTTVAQAVHSSGKTLEEYLGINSVYPD